MRSMGSKTVLLASLLALAAGCSVVAGVQDLTYGEPTADTLPNEPPRAATIEGGAGSAADAASVSTETDDTTPDAGADATLVLDASVDAAPDAADAAVVPPVEVDEPDDVGGAGCTAAEFAAGDRRAPETARTILFPIGAPATYFPRCMIINVGQSVTWQGNLIADPLAPLSVSPANPISVTFGGNSKTVAFPKKGRYRYGSLTHSAMRGAIDVRP